MFHVELAEHRYKHELQRYDDEYRTIDTIRNLKYFTYARYGQSHAGGNATACEE